MSPELLAVHYIRMIDLNLVVAFTTILINGSLAGVIILNSPIRKRSTQLFLATIVLILLWTMANYLVDKTGSALHALWYMRAMYAFAVGFILTFFLFAEQFGDIYSPLLTRLSPFVTALAVAALLATVTTSLVFSHAVVGPNGLTDLTFGPLYLPINFCCLALVFWSTAGLLQKRMRTSQPLIKEQILLIIIGWVVFLGLTIIASAILPYFFPALVNASKITPLLSILMVATATYSIIRHQFLDIKLIIQRGLIYSILLGCILGMYVAGILSLTHIFSLASEAAVFLSGGVTVIVGVFGAPAIETFFKRHTDRIFFKDTYEYSVALETLGAVLNANLLLPRLTVRSLRSLDTILRPTYIYFVQSKSGARFGLEGRFGVRVPTHAADPGEVRVPIHSSTSRMGEFVLGPKRSGDAYTAQDHALLRTFGIQAAVAFQKAELYEQLKEHSELLEQKVLERTRHLEELRAHQRQFMDDISHALQTPLSVLKSTLEVLPTAPANAQGQFMKTMGRSVDDLSRLIRNLLELAAIDAISEQSAFEAFNLSRLVAEVIEYVRTIGQEHAITIRTHIEPGLQIRGDRHQTEEAITNVLSNAVRYTKDQSERTITVVLEKIPAAIRLTIADTGIGIAEEKLPHIFERFYRAQQEQGSGLGLAIAKRIMERHQGTITATSSLGKGTSLVFTFPIPKDARTEYS